jgi:DNA-binding NarL/FixJ family response regulator
MGKITAYFSTDNKPFFRHVHRGLSAHPNIELRTGPAEELSTLELMQRWHPDVALLDPVAFRDDVPGTVERISACSAATKLLFFYEDCNQETVVHCLKHGVSGCLATACTSAEVLRAIQAVHDGEFWAPRKTMMQAFQQLRTGKRETDGHAGLRAHLSPRECEIVDWMRRGMSNKEIGRVLNISDMTVKTHVHNIFHKLEISGRVRLLGSINVVHARARAALKTSILMDEGAVIVRPPVKPPGSHAR